MLQVKITTPEERKTVIIDESLSVIKILEDQEVILTGAAIAIDGITLTATEVRQSLDTFTDSDSCRITVTVKSDNGVA